MLRSARLESRSSPIARKQDPSEDRVYLDLFDAGQGEEEAPEGASSALDPSPEKGPTVWTVSQVNKAVRALLEESLPPLWISGEVTNWKRAASGHCYFSLKDESAQLRCVMWQR